MAKKNLGVLLPVVCISAALCASCSADTAPMFSILEGTVSWARKDWTGATTAFLGVADAEPDAVRDSVREYAVYALASVYLSQEEYNAALQRLSSVSDAAPEGLQSSKWYQAGVIAFRKGLFEDAASYFRKSLEAAKLIEEKEQEITRLLAELRQKSAALLSQYLPVIPLPIVARSKTLQDRI